MKKKQLLTLLMAGTLSLGLPAMAYAEAAADGAAVEQEVSQEETGAPAEEIPADVPVETPAETPADVPAETPAEAPSNEENQAPEQSVETTPTADPAETIPTEQPTEDATNLAESFGDGETAAEQTGKTVDSTFTIKIVGKDGVQIGQDYAALEEAIAAAAEVENPITADVTQILITGTVTLDKTIVIGAKKSVSIAAGEAGSRIERADGFTGDMFSVTDGGVFQFGKGVADGGDVYDLTVDGALSDTIAAGSIISVNTGSYFGMADGVSLTGNVTASAGAAIRNEGGSLGLSGGTITNNQSSVEAEAANGGGAVYSTGEVRLAGNIRITGNSNDGNVDGAPVNVVLNGEGAKIIVVGRLGESADVSVKIHDAAAGRSVLGTAAASDGTSMTIEEAKTRIKFSIPEGWSIREDGILVPTVTETPTNTPTPTPTVQEEEMILTGKSASWVETDRTAAVVKFVGDKDGFYYVTWAKRGSKAPKYDEALAVNPMYAGLEVSCTVSGLDEDSSIDIYVFAKDTKGVAAKAHKIFQLRDDKRPEKEPTITTRAPYTPKVSESTVKGLEKPLEFYPGKTYSFSVIGAGTSNTDPVKGDVQWRPLYWSSYSNPTSSQRQSIGTIGHKTGIKRAATFNMYVFFQKYVYDGSQWQPTNVVESCTYKFQSKAIDFTTTPGGTITPTITSAGGYGGYGGSGYGDDDGYDDPESRTDDDTDTGVTSTSSNADTADNSPVGVMMMLASLSLLTGGYVLVRKRKKV